MTAKAREGARRLRVVQVSFHPDVHRRDAEALLRAWPTLPAVAAGAVRAGVDVTVVQAAHRSQSFERDGVSFHFVDDVRGKPMRLGGVPLPRTPKRLIEQVRKLNPDVVHVHGLIYPWAVRQLTRAMDGVPVLAQDHGSAVPRGWRRTAWSWAYRSLSGVAFTAREQATPFQEVRAFRRDLRVFEVLEGSSHFAPGDRDSARRETGMFGEPCLLWTGRLDANKDPFTALAAFELAAPRLPDARLWCCFGKAPLLESTKRYIAASPVLRHRVTLVGTRPHEEMELRFRAADFFIQTSHREGSGYSLLEALSCGTPALVTDIPAARRIVGDVGSLTPVGDANSLAEAMVAWAACDPRPLRHAARSHFERTLTFEAIGQELRKAYEALVAVP